MILIYVLTADPLYVDLATAVLDMVEAGEVEGIASTLTLTEILTAPMQAEDEEAVLDYELYLTNFPNLTVYPLDLEVARRAARVRATTGLRTPDAVQVATAQIHRADMIVTNNKSWQSKLGDDVVLILDDYRDG
jgi:predicted nucleic acid-binding protein